MKHLFALFILLVCCLVLSGCATHATRPTQATRPKDVTTVKVWRTYSLDVHADKDFAPLGRALIDEAAMKWRTVSSGHIDIRPVYDLDFDSIENLREHATAGHSTLFGLSSNTEAVATIDARVGGSRRTLGFTTTRKDDSHMVIIVMDRVAKEMFLSVVVHELGHVIGFPDLPSTGSIMSGASYLNAPSIEQFTADDIALCRAFLYCN